jgi:hypothetical protein
MYQLLQLHFQKISQNYYHRDKRIKSRKFVRMVIPKQKYVLNILYGSLYV